MNIPKIYNEKTGSDDATNVTDTFREKLIDAETAGFQDECDPNEADCAGVFVEDALSEEDALDTAIDLIAAMCSMATPSGDFVPSSPGSALTSRQN
ncbi:hypothetical protein [Xylella fastidiosa]|uniref:Conjugal transfer protein n=1 Tax=Xylella fastidiosa subsp. sandyi Ann-1 TaxID=155920 RepID=A0A060H472_XYLFS|nr:hypothetical protein [Xylella fastidiosa]AIC10115.1 conjugal transfer protein [Xylella fastidiosa subsp. sandyi Ann-1]UIX82001.1 protein TraD [Xylella fastidiosa subsp. sandyi]